MTVQLRFLGGLGEFGANSLAVTAGNEPPLVVDAGAGFLPFEAFGVAYEVPDWAALLDEGPAAALITHAHDDHMKGLGRLVAEFPDTAVRASRTALIWSAEAVDEDHRVAGREFAPGEVLAGMEVDALPVSHSIPGTVILRLGTPAGRLVHASDLRLAPSALEEATDREVMARWGDEGVELALLDATNALDDATPPEESTVAATLADLIGSTPGLVVAVSFASQVGRFRQLALAAAAAGRVVVPVGQGLLRAVRVGKAAGHLALPAGLIRHSRELVRLPRDRVVVVATGSQGEFGSAFPRLVYGEMPAVRLGPGDRVLHAARVIPGHDRRVADLLDGCARAGAEVVTAGDAAIHSSGHLSQAEMREALELLRPRWVIPVHGRRRNLEAAAALARGMGCRTLVVESGEDVAWNGEGPASLGRQFEVSRVPIAQDGSVLPWDAVRARRKLGREGVVIALLALDANGGRPADPTLRAEGVPLADALVTRLARELGDEVRRVSPLAQRDPDVLRSTMASWLRRELWQRVGRRPVIIPVVAAHEQGVR